MTDPRITAMRQRNERFLGGAYDCWQCWGRESMRVEYGREPVEPRYVRDDEPPEFPPAPSIVGWRCAACGYFLSNRIETGANDV